MPNRRDQAQLLAACVGSNPTVRTNSHRDGMKISLMLLSIFISFTAIAASDNDDPKKKFNTSDRFTTKTTITWIVSDDVQTECNTQSRKAWK